MAIRWPEVGRNEIRWPGANTRPWHVHDGQVRWISTGLGLWERWLPWQQLQLVLCWVNNFYGKLSSNVARTIRSNDIDIWRFLWKLLAIICVPGFFWDTVYNQFCALGIFFVFFSTRILMGKCNTSFSAKISHHYVFIKKASRHKAM